MSGRSVSDRVFGPLAASLVRQAWTALTLRQHLQARLPQALSAEAPGLARDLKAAFPGTAAPDRKRVALWLSMCPLAGDLVTIARASGAPIPPPLDPDRFQPPPAFAGLDLPPLGTLADLADWLALTLPQLSRFSDLHGISAAQDNPFAPHYHHHLLEKRDGTQRLLEEPKPVLKHLQRRVLRQILAQIPPHPAAFGFCAGRSCLQAAQRHAGEALVVSFDLKAFFPSIGWHRVYGLFRAFGYPPAVARHLAGLCTAITPPRVLAAPRLAARDLLTNRHLPQGAPTSPALANLTAYALDARLAGLARSLGLTYTRYADDLTFSGDTRPAAALHRAVADIVSDCGFTLNRDKTRVQPRHRRQLVTGVVVNRHLNLPRADYDRLKAIIHHLRNPDDPRRADRVFLDRLAGRIAWLEQINPAKGAKLRDRLAAALATTRATRHHG